MILFTLLIQGLTLPLIIERSKLFDYGRELPEDEAKMKVKNHLVVETIRLLKEKQKMGEYEDPHLQKMIDQWEYKISQPEHLRMTERTKQNYLELLENQRKFLSGLNKDPELHEEYINWQIYQIDLEEERIRLL